MLMFEWFYTSHLFWWGQEGISICLCLYSFTPVFFFVGSGEGFLYDNVQWIYTSYLFR
jgi:hypothetical protein